jgi:hypothetical protein
VLPLPHLFDPERGIRPQFRMIKNGNIHIRHCRSREVNNTAFNALQWFHIPDEFVILSGTATQNEQKNSQSRSKG